MGSTKPSTINITTNVEKKTRKKVQKMNDDILNMDFILKNKRLLGEMKVCRVKLAKISKNRLLKKKISKTGIKKGVNKNKNKNMLKMKSKSKVKVENKRKGAELIPSTKVSGKNKKIKNEKSPTSNTEQEKKIANQNKTITPNQSKTITPNQSKIISPNQGKTISPSKKIDDGKKKRQIYIRLPLLRNVAKLEKKPFDIHKDFKPSRRMSKTYLIQKFGKRYFQCHVKILRNNNTSTPNSKRSKSNRKSVSFIETVEVFGEESGESDCNDEIIGNKNDHLSTQTPNGNIGGSTHKAHTSSLRKSVEEDESPKRKLLRKSDEKIPSAELRKKIVEEDLADNDVEDLSNVIAITSSPEETASLEETVPNNHEECILPDNPLILFVEDENKEPTESNIENASKSILKNTEEKENTKNNDDINEAIDTNSNLKKNGSDEFDSLKNDFNDSKEVASTSGLNSNGECNRNEEDYNDADDDHDKYDDMCPSTENENSNGAVICKDKLSNQPYDDDGEKMKEKTPEISESPQQTSFSITSGNQKKDESDKTNEEKN